MGPGSSSQEDSGDLHEHFKGEARRNLGASAPGLEAVLAQRALGYVAGEGCLDPFGHGERFGIRG